MECLTNIPHQNYLERQMLKLKKALVCFIASMSVAATASTDFPNQPIRMIVPFSAGGAIDAAARQIGQRLKTILGQPVIIENKPGGSGTIGSKFVSMAPQDGHTILFTHIGHSLTPYFFKNVPYDPVKDFTPIAPLLISQNVVAVHPSVPASNMAELLEYGRKTPGGLFFTSAGVGTTQHLAGLLISQISGVGLEHVPYRGGGSSVVDVIGGQVPVAILTTTTVIPHASAGRLRSLAVIESKRIAELPNLPTVSETLKDFSIPNNWFGVLGPAGLNPVVTKRLNGALREAVQSSEVKAALEKAGLTVTSNVSADDFKSIIARDIEVFARIINSAGIKPE